MPRRPRLHPSWFTPTRESPWPERGLFRHVAQGTGEALPTNPRYLGRPQRSPRGLRLRRTNASTFLSGLRPSPRFRVLLRRPALRERNSSVWQPPIQPFHVRSQRQLGINPASTLLPAGRRQAGRLSFLAFLKKGVIKKLHPK
jgi:hypothetical protein